MSVLKHSVRVKMEKYIYDVFDRLDPSGKNTQFYRSFFSKMTDKEFDKFFDNFFKDKDAYLTWTITPHENDAILENIEKAAKFMDVPLYERVVFPFGSADKSKPIITPYPVPVGYMHEKRVQQTAIKKNKTSIEVSQRDAKTNQVINHDKNGMNTIDENYALATYGAGAAIKEFMSFRADDSVMKEDAYAQIRQKGYVSMRELPDNVENKTSLNMLDTYMLSMGLMTDLVTNSYLTVKSLKKRSNA